MPNEKKRPNTSKESPAPKKFKKTEEVQKALFVDFLDTGFETEKVPKTLLVDLIGTRFKVELTVEQYEDFKKKGMVVRKSELGKYTCQGIA
jgi:hypothetical protein